MNCGIQRDIHQTSYIGKTDWDLRQKRRFHVWKFWRFNQKCAVLVILFLCYCLFFMLYIALIWSELICLDSLRFIPTWLRMKSLRWVNIQQCYFWLFPEALGTLYSVFSNVLQTSTNTLNLSMSLFCGLSCFGSWYTKHSFGSKAFFSFQVKLEMLSIFRLLVLSKITLIHLMCMLV